MDNITHSIVGYAAGAALYQLGRRRSSATTSPELRSWLIAGSVVANNLPDLDIFFSGGFFSHPASDLGYLLNHRGYTHTLLASLPQALLLFVLMMAVRHLWRRPSFSRREAGIIFLGLFLGPLIHVGMDGLNSYGVHPLWPWSNHWFYGDFIFIVEPWLWLAFLPTLYFFATHRLIRALHLLFFVLALLACWFVSWVPWPAALTATGFAAGSWIIAQKSRRLAAGWGLGLIALALFYVTSVRVRHEVVRAHRRISPATKLTEVVTSPFPADPFCWDTISLESDVAGEWTLRRATFAPYAAIFGSDRCPNLNPGGGVVDLTPVAENSDAGVRWEGEYRFDSKILGDLSRGNCEVAQFLKFARVPYLVKRGESTILGDLRFDRKVGGFARFVVTEKVACNNQNAPWEEPRRELSAISRK